MTRKLTTEEFIAKAKKVHGDKYDYSKVEYTHNKTKVSIICPKHGEFWQQPCEHTRGRGCKECGREKRTKTTEQFIDEAKKVHGDKYDYSKTKYVNQRNKVLIVCPKHGEFQISPDGHVYQGQGCPQCAILSGNKRLKRTTEQFIDEAKKAHGDKYDYSKVEYIGKDEKVLIICPDHGEFWQCANSHLRGSGCNACGYEAVAKKKTKTTEQFIAKAKKVHGDKYDYSKTKYVKARFKAVITCPEHGDFEQEASSHLQGAGCDACGYEAMAKKSTKTTEQFIADAKKAHGDKYDYSKVEYVNGKTKVLIICPKHGEFWQDPGNHTNSADGCPTCGQEEATRKVTKTTEQFIADAKEVHGDKYDYSKAEYVAARTKVCIICPDHGEFWQDPNSHLSGRTGCHTCGKNLVSEPIFRKVLEEVTSLKFPKKRPKWLRNPNTNSLLELDCYNQKTKIAFELQGAHHYRPVGFWGGEEDFQKVLQRDQIKKTICEEKGIHLFCIDQRPATGKKPQEKEEYYKKEIKKCLHFLPEDIIIQIQE